MVTILHLTYELRDRNGSEKTTAVKQLIDVTGKVTNIITVDLLRVRRLKDEGVGLVQGERIEINTFGLPYGLFLLKSLDRAYSAIAKAADSGHIELSCVDAIHAHKLSFEGYIGYLLARRLKIPLLVSLRSTDFWVYKFRPDLHLVFKKILEQSAKIFYIAPYMIDGIQGIVGKTFFEKNVKEKMVFLPNIVEREGVVGNASSRCGLLLTVLRMTKKSVKVKNLRRLLKAVKQLEGYGVSLNVIGGGDYLPKVQSWVRKYNLCDKVQFLGKIPNCKIDKFFAEAQAFVMPSRIETFGMAYAEALINGTPIVYSKGSGFDGMFEGVGSAVAPDSVESIGAGIIDVIRNNSFYRERIGELRKNGEFRIFTSKYVMKTYCKAVNEVVGYRGKAW